MSSERSGQWLRGVLDLCVLGALCGGEAYGYALAQRLEAEGLGVVKGGTLYPVLGRLERAGLVASSWQEGEHGPGRKYYAITPPGRALLAEEGASWHRFAVAVGSLVPRGASR